MENLEVEHDGATRLQIHRLRSSTLREVRLTNIELSPSALEDLSKSISLRALILRRCEIRAALKLPIETTLNAIRLDGCTGIGVQSCAAFPCKLLSLDELELTKPQVMRLLNSNGLQMLSLQSCKLKGESTGISEPWIRDLSELYLDVSDALFPDDFLTEILSRPRIIALDLSGVSLSSLTIENLVTANADTLNVLELGDAQFGSDWQQAVLKMVKLRHLVSNKAVNQRFLVPDVRVGIHPWRENSQLWTDGTWR